MKKLFKSLLVLLAFTLALSSLCAFATEEEKGLYISPDLKTLRVDGVEYVRCVGFPNNVYGNYSYEGQIYFEGDASDITSYEICFENDPAYFNTYFCEAIYTYDDGARLISYYVRKDYAETYKNVSQGIGVKHYVDFYWPEGNKVYFGMDALSDELTYHKGYHSSDYFRVFTASDDDVGIEFFQGEMHIIDGEFYFMPEELNNGGKYTSDGALMGYLVTDEAVAAELKAGKQAYYDDDFGVFYDGSFADKFTLFMIVLVFVIVPLAALIFVLVLLIRGKDGYKKIYVLVISSGVALLGAVAYLAYVIISNSN